MRNISDKSFVVLGLASFLLCLMGLPALAFAGSDRGSGAIVFRHGEKTADISYPASFLSGRQIAAGKFLVAAENMPDPRFRETVILICRYDSSGAVGLIINRPAGMKLHAILPEMEGIQKIMDSIYIGGPVGNEQLFLLVRSDSAPEESMLVIQNIYLSSSPTVLKELLGGDRQDDAFRVYAGYAGWNPDQLAREISRGDWHVVEGDGRLIFDTDPSTVWPDLILRASVIQVSL